jgi:hypothetical protein
MSLSIFFISCNGGKNQEKKKEKEKEMEEKIMMAENMEMESILIIRL